MKNVFQKSNMHYSLDNELALAIALARKAGQVVRDIRTKGYKIQEKDKQQGPVTEADQAASDLLLQEIRQVFPHDLLISEEAPLPSEANPVSRIWFIDPIDGTKEFIANNGDWAVMIGLAINGNSCLGVVYQPDLDRLYYATKGNGAFLIKPQGRKRLKVSATSEPTQAVLIQSHSSHNKKTEQLITQLGISKILRQGSVGLKLGVIAEGRADLYFNFSGYCHLWDLCAPEIILQEAGGGVLLSSGKSILYNLDEIKIKEKFLAANNELLIPLSQFIK
ncbi:3'(2'),5'-bisphosphate nucleotidase CysQ family protein [Legionella feeleii]|uniref:Inositol monophosphatase n=1 Tax=Legionella feeleii TaxID=453 RepID=A0A0W0UAK3_9GAMM|nr:3'(2'),5'-bisphosphate nucleotidase CysQ [Legionella feeleii]KTD04668.1 inositol monophosphatase [Legionella feeleii]SPX59503.1 inositol monophosphatase [Legionella feeleii]